MLSRTVGHHFPFSTYNSTTLSDFATHNYLFAGSVAPFGSLAKTITFQSKCSKEDRCSTLPLSLSLSGDFAARVAQD